MRCMDSLHRGAPKLENRQVSLHSHWKHGARPRRCCVLKLARKLHESGTKPNGVCGLAAGPGLRRRSTMEIRVKLPGELVSRLHVDGRERDRRILSAIEEFLAIPILDATCAKPPQRAQRKRSPVGSAPTLSTPRLAPDNDLDHLRQLGAAVFGGRHLTGV